MEELYRNYGILADAKDNLSSVSVAASASASAETVQGLFRWAMRWGARWLGDI